MATRPTMRRAYGVRIMNSNHPEIRRLKREGNVAEIHGNKFWNSSFLVMDYLKKNPLRKRVRVLEIGCGWGLLGIYCAREFDARVTGIDADENVLPYMALHADVNDVKVTGLKMSFQQLTVEKLKQYDVILGADICFWDEMTGLLYNLIGRAFKAGVSTVMIADPCRPPFGALVEKCRKKYGDNVHVEEKWLTRPVHASGEILIVRR
ncbi:MAG: methyltransferase domain-containing protein [Pseudomonadales bacterium]|nr:methyltransferase domain-containing protein [Pseudomonadales bacterium]